MEKKAVLITGSGPTGLTLANLLARMGIPFYLIDKKKEPSRDSKAFAIHARSLEIFSQLGITEKAIEQGSIDTNVHFVIKNREKTVFRLKNFISGKSNYPHLLILAQNKTEQLLIDALKLQNQKVHWQHELVGFESHKTGVEAVIKTPAGEEKKMKFRYLAGCIFFLYWFRCYLKYPGYGKKTCSGFLSSPLNTDTVH